MAEGVINVISTHQKYAQRLKKVFIYFGRVQNERTLFLSVENTVRLDKTRQLHEQIRCNICNVAHRERKQTKGVPISFVLELCTFLLYSMIIIIHYDNYIKELKDVSIMGIESH